MRPVPVGWDLQHAMEAQKINQRGRTGRCCDGGHRERREALPTHCSSVEVPDMAGAPMSSTQRVTHTGAFEQTMNNPISIQYFY